MLCGIALIFHCAAVLSVFLVAVPWPVRLVLLGLIAGSCRYSIDRALLRHPACITEFRLSDVDCVVVFRGRTSNGQALLDKDERSCEILLQESWYCTPLIQVLRFTPPPAAPEGSLAALSLQKLREHVYPLTVIVLPDSTSGASRRRLRRFLQWERVSPE